MKFLTCGDQIKSYRKMLNISQRELGMGLININTISKIERNELAINPRIAYILSSNINALARQKGITLNVTVSDLLTSPEKRYEKWCTEELEKISKYTDAEEKKSAYKALVKSISENSQKHAFVNIFEQYADFLYELSDFNEAAGYYTMCMKYYKQYQNAVKTADTADKLGSCFYKSDMDKSIYYYQYAYNTIQSVPYSEVNKNLIARIIYHMALYNVTTDQLSAAQGYLEDMNKFCDIDKNLYIKFLILQGIIKQKKSEFSEAKDIWEVILLHPVEIIGDQLYIIYNNLGICFENLNDTDNALKYLDMAINLQLQSPSLNFSDSLLIASKLFLKRGKTDIALRYAEQALERASENNQFENASKCYFLIYKIYKDKKDMENCKNTIDKCEDFLKEKKSEKASGLILKFLKIDFELFKNSYYNNKQLAELLNDID